jgi:hypothetical protein
MLPPPAKKLKVVIDLSSPNIAKGTAHALSLSNDCTCLLTLQHSR